MSKFRKKPVEITAEQWFPNNGVKKGVHWERRSGDDGEFMHPYVITAHEQRAYLAPGEAEPKKLGFALFIFEFDRIEANRVNYISNALRPEMLVAVREWLARAEGRVIEPGRQQ